MKYEIITDTQPYRVMLSVAIAIIYLYRELNVSGLPIETSKLEYMCRYMAQDEKLKDKLVDLCHDDLPLKNKYIDEMNAYLYGYYNE